MKPNTDNADNPLCECANCGLHTLADNLLPPHDIWSRIQPGEIMPHGDCPDCRAFCYPVKELKKRPPLAIFSAMERLLDCPDLNLDELEKETRAAIDEAQSALAEGFVAKASNVEIIGTIKPAKPKK